MKLEVVTFDVSRLNSTLHNNGKGGYVVERADLKNDKIFFLLKKSSSRHQIVQEVSTNNKNFEYSYRIPPDVAELNKKLDEGWYVVDVYNYRENMLYLLEKQTLKQKRKEKLDNIEKSVDE